MGDDDLFTSAGAGELIAAKKAAMDILRETQRTLRRTHYRATILLNMVGHMRDHHFYDPIQLEKMHREWREVGRVLRQNDDFLRKFGK